VEGATRPRGHALVVAACFVLAFMTKFLAALFLPLVCMAALAARRDGCAKADSEFKTNSADMTSDAKVFQREKGWWAPRGSNPGHPDEKFSLCYFSRCCKTRRLIHKWTIKPVFIEIF